MRARLLGVSRILCAGACHVLGILARFEHFSDRPLLCLQISNSTTVHVRRPGNPKKWRARLLCEGIICDLALLTVDEEEFWSEDLMSLQFVDVPELQVYRPCSTCLCLS